MYGSSTNSSSDGSVLTTKMLLACLESMPKPIGYALLTGSKHVSGQAYRLDTELKIGNHLYMLVVPEHFLPTAAASLRAHPCNDFEGAYRFDVWATDHDEQETQNATD